ncbi:MAG: TIGR03560 family F420-dependent LLM class oxidoreductase [Nitrososphaerota archaeon]|nr:TIGR03560 family F420-dependent LLM class oxidoreductase [Nitrososphaerota archaeon]
MAGVKFGLIVPQGWRLDLPNVDARQQFKMVSDTALFAEKLGFQSVWLYDHFLTYPQVRETSCFDSWTTLTALAPMTKKARLGTIVTCSSYRQPALLAKMSSVLDVVSGGRLELGIGAGWYEQEYRAYGYQFPSDADRVRMLDESLTIIREMWTKGTSTFAGKYYSTSNAMNYPRPVQKPHPPITVGGGGERLMLRVVAKHADRWNGQGDVETFRRKLDVLKKHCDEVGRKPEKIEKTYWGLVSVDGNKEKAVERAKKMPTGATFDQFMARNAVGTPQDIAAFYNRYVDIGITYFIVYVNDAVGLRSLRLFAEEVIPRVE